MNRTLLSRFGWYVAERQSIWRRRQAGDGPPWTVDPTLASHHFINIYRELDPGTIYAQDRLSEFSSRVDRVWFTVAYRMINRRQTVEEYTGHLGVKYTEDWLAYLNDRFDRGLPVRTRRHLTPRRAYHDAGLRSITEEYNLSHDPSAAFQQLTVIRGVGEFLGWQMHCDLVQHDDINYDPQFVHVGDGAAYSIAVLYGVRRFEDYWHDGRAGVNIGRRRDVGGRVRASRNPTWYASVINWLVETQGAWLPSHWCPWENRALDAKNIEHSLCEWMRWERLSRKHGE